MAYIDELRTKYKGTAYDSMTDMEIADYISQTTKRPLDAVQYDLGIHPADTPGFGTALQNSLYGVAQGAGQLAGDTLPGVENNNALEMFGRAGQERNPIATQSFHDIAEHPGLALREAAGMGLGYMMPAGLAKAGIRGYQAIRGLEAAAGAGEATGLMGAAKATGEAGYYGLPTYGQTRDYQEQTGQNAPEDLVRAGLTSLASGAIESRFGPEAMLSRGKIAPYVEGAGKNFAVTGLKSGLSEAGEELLQQPLQAYGQGQDPFSSQSMNDAAFSATMGFLGGFPAGAAMHPFMKKAEAPLLTDSKDPVNLVGDNQSSAAPAALPNYPNQTMTAFPDGSVGTQEQVDQYVAQLPPELQTQARAALMGYGEMPQINLGDQNGNVQEAPNGQVSTQLAQGQNAVGQEATSGQEANGQTPNVLDQSGQTTAPAQVFQDPDTGEALPTAEDVGATTVKRRELFTQVSQARHDGLISQDKFVELANDIANTKATPTRLAPRIQKELDRAKLAQSPSNVTEAIASTELAPQQRAVVDYITNAFANNEQDKVVDASGTWKYQDIANALKIEGKNSRRSVQKAINDSKMKIQDELQRVYGDAAADMPTFLSTHRTRPQTVHMSTEDRLGESPAFQDQVVDEQNLFGQGDQGDRNMSIIKSLGASQSNIGANIGDVEQAPGYDENDVSPSDKAAQSAIENRRQLFQEAIDSQDSVAAAEDWDELKSDDVPEFMRLSSADKADWIIFYSHNKLNEHALLTYMDDMRGDLDLLSEAEYEKIRHAAFHPNAIQDGNELGADRRGLGEGASSENKAAEVLGQGAESVAAPRDEVQTQSSEVDEAARQAELDRIAEAQKRDERTATAAATDIQEQESEQDQPAKNSEEAQPTARVASAPAVEQSPEARLLTRLRNIAADKPVAREYIDRAKAGEDVFDEASKYVKAVEADQLDMHIKAGVLFVNKKRWIHREATPEQLAALQPTLDNIRANGWGSVLDKVASINVVSDKEFPGDAGVQELSDGTYLMFVHPNLLEGRNADGSEQDIENSVQRILDHEMAHVADTNARAYSGRDSFNDVVAEITKLARRGDIAAELFAYPINFKGQPGFDFKAEVFAELMSAYKSPELADILKRAPMAYQFAQGVDNEFRNFQTESRAGHADLSGETPDSSEQHRLGQPAAGEHSGGLPEASNSQAESSSGESVTPEKVGGVDLRVQAKAQETGRDFIRSLGFKLKKLAPNLLTYTQLEDQYGKDIKALKRHVELTNEMVAEESKLTRESHKLVEAWGKFAFRSKEANKQLMLLMNEATRLGIHPDLAFDDAANSHLGLKDRAAYDDLSAKYRRLATEAKDIYQQSKGILSSHWELRKEIFKDVVESAYDKRITEARAANDDKRAERLTKERDRAISDHAEQIKQLKGPYFPLLRFGDNIVVAESPELNELRERMNDATGEEYKKLAGEAADMEKSPKHYVVEAFEKRIDAEKRREELTAANKIARVQLAEQYTQELRPVSAGSVERISEALGSQFDSAATAKIKDMMTQMYVSSLPEHHALERQIKRKGVAGASTDMLRAFSDVVERDAFYLSRMKYNKDLTSNLFAMARESKRLGVDSQNVYNNVVRRVEGDYHYQRTPVINWLARASSIFHLGVAPSYLLTNMTQPWMISVPQLAGTHGIGKTLSAMRSAWVDAGRIIKQGKGGKLLNLADVDFSNVRNPNERAMLQRLLDTNKLEATQLIDMGKIANGLDPRLLRAQKAFDWATHHIELVNRISTALATYRLEKTRNPNASEQTLIDKATQMIDLTQLDYSPENRAYFMRHDVGLGKLNKLIFQFRSYQQGMLYLLARDAKLAFAGDKQALKSLGVMMTMQVLTAGATGMPLTAALLLALNAFSHDDDDEDGDWETQFRNGLTDMYGADAARAIWKGLPNLLGVDLSNNLGMGSLLSPFPMAQMRDFTQGTGKDKVKNTLLGIAGAPAGMVASVLDGLGQAGGAVSDWNKGSDLLANGDFLKGMAALSPKFVGSLLRAYSMNENGVTTRTGNQVMSPDQFSGWDLAYRALGFNPTASSEHYAAQTAKENVSTAITQNRSNLLRDYALTKMNGGDLDGVNQQISDFNQKHPAQKIDYSTKLKAVTSRKANATNLDETGTPFTAREKNLRPITRFAMED